MHDSRGAQLKVGDRVFVECEITELQSGADPNYCNVVIKAVTPEQREKTPMSPPSGMVFNTKMLTKIGVCILLLFTPIGSVRSQQLAQLQPPPGGLPPGTVFAQPKPVIEIKQSFKQAYDEAMSSGKRIAIFVGIPSRQIDGVVCVSVPWEGDHKRYPNKSLVVATNHGKHDNLYILGVVDPLKTLDDEIRYGGMTETALFKKEARQSQPKTFQSAAGACADGQCSPSQQMAPPQLRLMGAGGGDCASGNCGGASRPSMGRRR